MTFDRAFYELGKALKPVGAVMIKTLREDLRIEKILKIILRVVSGKSAAKGDGE